MAKLSLDVVTNGATLSTLNANFDKIESEFQNRVLYRDNVSGETNTVVNDIDMDGNNISNIDTVFTQALVVNGVVYEVVLQGFVDAATAQAAIATAQAIIATNQANTSGAHAAASLNSANNSAASAADALASELAAAASAASIANGPVFSFNGRFGVVTLTETDVLDTGVLDDAALTGVPTAPTAAAGTTTTQIATTAFVAGNATNAPSTMNGVGAIGTSTRHARGDHVHPTDTSRAPLASPAFTGVPTAPTATAGTNTTQLATTAFVTTADALKANLASPTFTGTPAAPTAAAGTSTTQLATTAFVTTADNLKANLASPTFTGTPAAPTATAGTNTTQLATTAFVTAAAALKANLASPTFTGTVTAPNILSTNNLGFTTGGGGSVTQLTSKSTSVTLNKCSGQIVMNAASLAGGATVAFPFLNSLIGATDIVLVSRASGGTDLAYSVGVDVIGAGFCNVFLKNLTGGALAEAVTLTFIVIKASTT